MRQTIGVLNLVIANAKLMIEPLFRHCIRIWQCSIKFLRMNPKFFKATLQGLLKKVKYECTDYGGILNKFGRLSNFRNLIELDLMTLIYKTGSNSRPS